MAGIPPRGRMTGGIARMYGAVPSTLAVFAALEPDLRAGVEHLRGRLRRFARPVNWEQGSGVWLWLTRLGRELREEPALRRERLVRLWGRAARFGRQRPRG